MSGIGKTMNGADFLFGNIGERSAKKGASKRIDMGAEYVTPEDIQAVMAERGAGSKAIVSGVRGVLTGLAAIRESGLTGEAFVYLVHGKCRRPAKGGKPPSTETVAAVLEALFRLEEYLSK